MAEQETELSRHPSEGIVTPSTKDCHLYAHVPYLCNIHVSGFSLSILLYRRQNTVQKCGLCLAT